MDSLDMDSILVVIFTGITALGVIAVPFILNWMSYGRKLKIKKTYLFFDKKNKECKLYLSVYNPNSNKFKEIREIFISELQGEKYKVKIFDLSHHLEINLLLSCDN